MNKILTLILFSVFSLTSWGDIVPKNPRPENRYIKVTEVQKYGQLCRGSQKNFKFIKFEVCIIDRIVDGKIFDKSCHVISSNSSRKLYQPSKLKNTEEFLRINSRVHFGFFMWLEAGRLEGKRQSIRDEVVSDKDITLYTDSHTRGMTYEEETALSDDPLNEVTTSIDMYIKELKGALDEYDKEYPEVCSIEESTDSTQEEPANQEHATENQNNSKPSTAISR